jgi:hypothetical protein
VKPLHIELLPPRHPSRWVWAALLMLAVTAAAVWAWQALQRNELRQVQAQTTELAQATLVRRQAAAVTPPAQRPAYDASARALLAQREAPWPTILAAMESITIEGATPVLLDVSSPEHTARIELNATSYAAVLAYLNALNQGDPALQWRLLQVNATGGEGGQSMTAVLALQMKL